MRRRFIPIKIGFLVLISVLLASSSLKRAQAASFVVNSAGDQDDANLADGICATSTNTCTLRAAIEQANTTGGVTINFTLGNATIQPTTNLPPITANSIVINGGGQITLDGSAIPVSTVTGPRIGLWLEETTLSKVQGLTLRAFDTAISISPAPAAPIFNRGGFNFIGTDGDGQNDALEGNVISGNGIGVEITNSPGNRVAGNQIGTDATGTVAVPNGTGIYIVGGSVNIIGTNGDGQSDALERNIISGNRGQGVELNGGFLNKVAGNYIGVNASGSAALGNGSYGVLLIGQSSDNWIGYFHSGDAVVERNVISGNGAAGVGVSDGVQNIIDGNYIGLNAAGSAALANNGDGIEIVGPTDIGEKSSPNQWLEYNKIGYFGFGDPMAERNVISGNKGNGISILNSSFNTVAANAIGTDSTGTLPIGNSGHGIYLAMTFNFFTSATNDNMIGGFTGQQGNVIAFNTLNGVTVGNLLPHSAQPDRNAILSNSIFSNGLLGIDLVNDGSFGVVTQNVPVGTAVGSNSLMNFPVLSQVTRLGKSIAIQGTMSNFLALTPLKVQFFSSARCNASGYGEGQTFMGELNLTTDLSGNANFTFHGTSAADNMFTATATQVDPAGGRTSEFSRCVAASFLIAKVFVISPTGFIHNPNPAFIWRDVPGTQSYSLILRGPKGRAFDISFDAAQICNDGLCTVYLGLPLTDGKYEWRVRAEDPTAKVSLWSRARTFIMVAAKSSDSVVPGPTPKVAPTFVPSRK